MLAGKIFMQNLYNYQTICNKTLNYFSLTNEEYKTLILSMVKYVQDKFNLQDVKITFDYDSNNAFEAISDKTYIKFSEKMLDYNKSSFSSPIEALATIYHEFAHILDEKQNLSLPEDKRRKIDSFELTIQELTKVKPVKKLLYQNAGFAMYYVNRCEAYARLFAILEVKKFVKDLNNYIKEQQNNQNANTIKNSLTQKSMSKMLRLYMGYVFCLEKFEPYFIKYYKTIKNITINTVRKDYINISNKIISSTEKNSKYEKFDERLLVDLLQIPELFNQELAKKLYHFFKEQEDNQMCEEISRILNSKNIPHSNQKDEFARRL